MTSPARAVIAPPSWGRAPHPAREGARPALEARPRPRVRLEVRAAGARDVAAAAAVLGATAGLWTAFLLAVW